MDVVVIAGKTGSASASLTFEFGVCTPLLISFFLPPFKLYENFVENTLQLYSNKVGSNYKNVYDKESTNWRWLWLITTQ